MASGDVPEIVLKRVDERRRDFLKKLILGSAFVVPSVASFSMAGLSVDQVAISCANQTDFSGQNLHGQNLSGCNLAGDNFNGANLSNANLTNTHLDGANLTDADLSGATLNGANLQGVIWSSTTCPDGTSSGSGPRATCIGHLGPPPPG
jgi:uncharacterized protein YjbI with pentapeptide repeats